MIFQGKNFFNRIFLSVCVLYVIKSGFAQDFEVAPVVINFSVEPGQSETRKVTVRNHSDKPTKFLVTLSDVIKDSTGKQKLLPPGTAPRSCAKWMTLNPSFFEAGPNEAKDFEVIMKVPSDGFSTKWALIYVKPTEEQTPRKAEKIVSAGIHVTPRITIHVYQSPSSNTKYRAGLSDFIEITKPADSLRQFQVMINNIGDKKTDSKVYLVVSNVETAEEQKFSPVKVSTYPDESKQVSLPLPVKLPSGTYSLAAILDYGNRTPLEAVQMTIVEK